MTENQKEKTEENIISDEDLRRLLLINSEYLDGKLFRFNSSYSYECLAYCEKKNRFGIIVNSYCYSQHQKRTEYIDHVINFHREFCIKGLKRLGLL